MRVRGCIVLLKNNKILLAKHEKPKEEYFVLPGGTIKHGESIVEGTKRELKEECSLKVKIKKFLGIGEFIEKDRHTIDIYFLGEVKSGELKVKPEEVLKEAKWVKIENLQDINFRPQRFKKWFLENYENNFKSCKAYLGKY